MAFREPHEFPRRILLATTGLNPQILTETLYALAVTGDPPFVPTEIQVITTAEGRHRLTLTLLDPSSAVLAKFAAEFGLPGVAQALTPERIHVIAEAGGRPLSDIASEADNAAAANLITRIVRELTSDGEAALHVSLAGGRKTMGFLLGYALTLFGRPQDRLSHVLVDQPFEMHPEFFYPPKSPRVLTTRDGRPINTADARLLLAEIPFVPLRLGMPKDLLKGAASYSETVARAEQGFMEPELVIDHRTRRILCHGRLVMLPPKRFAVYAWLARRRKEGKGLGRDGSIHWWEASRQDAADLLAEYGATAGVAPNTVRDLEASLANAELGAVPGEVLEQDKSRINRALREVLGYFAAPYEIVPRGEVPGTAYTRIGLALDPEAIRFGSIEATEE